MIVNGKAKDVKSHIRQLRYELLIHACLYHWLWKPVISDNRWDEMCSELKAYQNAYPESCSLGFYDMEFKDWNGTGSLSLPYDDHDIVVEAQLFYNSRSMRQL